MGTTVATVERIVKPDGTVEVSQKVNDRDVQLRRFPEITVEVLV